MKGTAKIKGLGTINLSGVSIGNGQIEVHIPVEDVSGQLDKVLDECTSDYMKTYKNVRSGSELNFDVRVVFSYGSTTFENGNNAEFNLLIIVWQQSDDITGRDTAKFYEEIPVAFDSVDTNKIKRIIWDGLGKAMFNFRIITCPDGTQVIDPSLKTPYSALTLDQMQEYMEMDSRITVMKRMKRKAAREADRQMKRERNPFYKIACACGLL